MPEVRDVPSGNTPEQVLAVALRRLTADLADLRSTVLARTAGGRINPTLIAVAAVATSETTTSTTFVDLVTVLSVAATIGPSGQALVVLTAAITTPAVSTTPAVVGFAVSGASTVAASDTQALALQTNNNTTTLRAHASAVHLVSGLTAGVNTFTQKYRVAGGTGTFDNRALTVIPL